MDSQVVAVLAGVSLVLALVLLWVAQSERARDRADLFRKTSKESTGLPRAQVSRRTVRQRLETDAAYIGQPERAEVWYRATLLASALPLVLAILFREPLFVLLIPLAFLVPLVYAREVRTLYRRNLERQTRQAEILVAFLMRSGAQMGETLQTLETHMLSPFRERIAEVNRNKRYTTLPGAMERLAHSTGVSQLADFAVLIGESERYGTPVADAVMRSLTLETKLRDARAARRYGEVQLQLSMIATFLIAFPGFGFVLYALVAYALSLFQGSLL